MRRQIGKLHTSAAENRVTTDEQRFGHLTFKAAKVASISRGVLALRSAAQSSMLTRMPAACARRQTFIFEKGRGRGARSTSCLAAAMMYLARLVTRKRLT